MSENQAGPDAAPAGAGQFTKQYYDRYVQAMSPINRPRTMQRVQAVLDMQGPKRGRLLTVGAGELVEPLAFKDAGFDVTIVDVASAQFERARQAGIQAHQVDLDRQAIPGQYDAVCCLEVLEHLVDPLGALCNLVRAVAPGGRLYVSLPEEFHLQSRLAILVGRPIFAHYNWAHLRLFNMAAARELVKAAGLRVVAIRHMPLVPPRATGLQGLGRALAKVMPGLFSLSHVMELSATGASTPGPAGPPGEGSSK